MTRRQRRNHLAIQKRPRRLAMQTQNHLSIPFIHVMNPHLIYVNIMWGKGKIWQILKPFIWRP
jgi:hypothetical protein